jgi:hypothetical protein
MAANALVGKMITKSRLAFGVWLLIWVLAIVCGITLLSGVTAQKVPGYPNQGQINCYVLFPGVMAIANALLVVFARRLSLSSRIIAFAIQLLALPAFIFYGSGGV